MQTDGGGWRLLLVFLLMLSLIGALFLPYPHPRHTHTHANATEARAHTGCHHPKEEPETVWQYLSHALASGGKPLHLLP